MEQADKYAIEIIVDGAPLPKMFHKDTGRWYVEAVYGKTFGVKFFNASSTVKVTLSIDGYTYNSTIFPPREEDIIYPRSVRRFSFVQPEYVANDDDCCVGEDTVIGEICVDVHKWTKTSEFKKTEYEAVRSQKKRKVTEGTVHIGTKALKNNIVHSSAVGTEMAPGEKHYANAALGNTGDLLDTITVYHTTSMGLNLLGLKEWDAPALPGPTEQ